MLELGESGTAVFLRGNHEVMMLEARNDALKADFWQSAGGLETLFSYGANYQDDWVSLIPDSHWKFLEETTRFLETDSHIFVHGGLNPELDMNEQPDDLLYWERFEQIAPHKSGKRIICGHTSQRFGKVKNTGFAVCIDTGAATGGWLTCLDADSGEFWQADEEGRARNGKI